VVRSDRERLGLEQQKNPRVIWILSIPCEFLLFYNIVADMMS
jgi:hypothetical protein